MKVAIVILMFLLMTNLTLAESKSKKEAKSEKQERLKHADSLKEKLGLSDEQMSKIRELRKNKKEHHKGERNKFRQAQKDFREGMKDPKVSNSELLEKFEAIQKERTTFQKKHLEHMLQMRSILTPEQMVKFHEMQEERRGKFKTRMKERMSKGRGKDKRNWE